jgi:hypothetical protein
MANFVTLYHSGVVITNEIDSYEFVGMKKETFLLNKFLTLANIVRLVRERLGWIDEGCEVQFECRIDIGSSNDPWMKTMSPVYDEKELTTYVGVVIKSKIHGVVLVARMVAHNDVGDESSRSSTLTDALDEQHIECGILLTQSSQETLDDTDVEDLPFVASNEIVLNVEPVCRSVGVGDAAVDMRFIAGVDPHPIAIGFVVDDGPSYVEPEFIAKYEATFGN